MDYFPAFLKLEGKPCLVIGAGNVAARKVRLLLAAGADVTIVAPAINSELSALRASDRVRCRQREFRDDDVSGQQLVVAATSDSLVQHSVFKAASAAGIFCNSVDDIENSSYITPAIVDRSPLIVAISTAGSAPVLARMIRARIETLLPARIGQLAELGRTWRNRVRQQLSTLLQRRFFWEQAFDGEVASAVYAGHADQAEKLMADLLHSTAEDHKNTGAAWLVGAGPGDPGLLTLRALQIMQQADVILHDRLVSAEVLELARRDADRISVGKTPGCQANSQAEINALLVSLVQSGKRVCRLKGGDPFIFGRGGEEVEALKAAGFSCEVVPGITAAAGCAASAGIPLTHRDVSQSVRLVTAHGKGSVDRLDWSSLASERQTLALYMAVQQFPTIMSELTANGLSVHTPVAIIERGTTDRQRIIRGALGQLNLLAKAHKVQAPAMLIIGDVAAMGASVGQSAQAGDGYPSGVDAEESAIHSMANSQ